MAWWKINFEGRPTQTDLDHIAEQIKEGYTEGEMRGEEED